jgi:predicted DNA-binding ribbon-helix-helix protein
VPSRLRNRNVPAPLGRTSIRLEPESWDALRELCLREGISEAKALVRADEIGGEGGFTSAVRMLLITYFRAAATEDRHKAAGHGGAERLEEMGLRG